MTDRWEGAEDLWPGRLAALAAHVPAGMRVLDVGAGAQGLRQLLPAGCTYTPVDLVARTPDTVQVDLDRVARLPGRWDVAVLAGVLEYLEDPARLLRLLRRHVRSVLCSYAHHRRENPDPRWRNTLLPAQLRRLACRAGWRPQQVGRWEGQTLWRLAEPQLRTNWCHTCGGGHNYGDQLTPPLLALAGIEPVWAPPAEARLMAVGSILSKLPHVGWTGTVLGTGTIRPGIFRDLSRARVLAVRGPHTRDSMRLPPGTPLGDLGLLADRLLPPGAARAVHPLGVCAHSVDQELAARHPGAHLVDVHLPPVQVVEGIASCARLVCSSLHALITADVLGVPHTWEPHPAVIGGSWKFTDYAAAVGSTVEPGVLRLSPRGAVQERQQELWQLLRTV